MTQGVSTMSKPQSSETPAPVQAGRRTALNKLLAGAGLAAGSQALPGSWIKPAISTAVLPAHAEASLGTCTSFEFSAEGNVEGFVENINMELEAPSSYNGEFEATFSSEGEIGIPGALEGVIELASAAETGKQS